MHLPVQFTPKCPLQQSRRRTRSLQKIRLWWLMHFLIVQDKPSTSGTVIKASVSLMHETPAGDDFPQTILSFKCCTELQNTAKKGIPIDLCNVVQGKKLSMFSQLESLGIYRKDSSLQKNGDCVFTKRRVCLCRPDVYKKLVDWRGALLEADECYLCIWYMLVDFQLITKKKTGVPAQQGGLAWRREMLRGSIRKYLPPV